MYPLIYQPLEQEQCKYVRRQHNFILTNQNHKQLHFSASYVIIRLNTVNIKMVRLLNSWNY